MENSRYDGILGKPAMRQASITIFLHQLHIKFVTNKGKVYGKHNQGVVEKKIKLTQEEKT